VAHDASQLLGAQQLAGTTVNPKGFGWKTATAGVPVIGHVVAKHAQPDTSETPKFPRIAFLAVTDQEVALLKIGSGGLNGRLDEVIARVSRSQVASGKVSRGMLALRRDDQVHGRRQLRARGLPADSQAGSEGRSRAGLLAAKPRPKSGLRPLDSVS